MNNPIILACASGQLGGTEMRMMAEAELLRDLGYPVEIAVSDFPSKAAYKTMLANAGISSFDFDPPKLMNDWRRRYWHWLKSELWIRHTLRRRHPRLIHVFFPWTNQGLDHLWLAGRCHIPTIISVHNAFPKTNRSAWHRTHLNTAFRSLKGVYGVSDSALAHFMANFDEFLPADARHRVIYNFVDVGRFQPSPDKRQALRARLGLGADTPLIGSVGRLDRQKQPLTVLGTFARIKRQYPDAHLLFVGNGNLENAVRSRIDELELTGSVTLAPFQQDIETVFPALDLHILMSSNEGFGIATAEAMASGVPVVATDVTGTEEVAKGCAAARLVAVGDEDAAAEASLAFLSLDGTARDEMSRAARQHIETHFSKDIWRRHVTDFYEAVLNS